jgi:hypothetical protein
MQALKQAAREGNAARLDALCEAWSVSAAEASGTDSITEIAKAAPQPTGCEDKVETVREAEARVEARR